MKRIILGITVILVAVLATGCTHHSPESVTKALLNGMKNHNAKKVADCFYYEGTDAEKKAQRDQAISMFELAFNADKDLNQIQSFKIIKVDSKSDDEANVTVSVTLKDGHTDEEDVHTIKKDGKWYVTLF